MPITQLLPEHIMQISDGSSILFKVVQGLKYIKKGVSFLSSEQANKNQLFINSINFIQWFNQKNYTNRPILLYSGVNSFQIRKTGIWIKDHRRGIHDMKFTLIIKKGLGNHSISLYYIRFSDRIIRLVLGTIHCLQTERKPSRRM